MGDMWDWLMLDAAEHLLTGTFDLSERSNCVSQLSGEVCDKGAAGRLMVIGNNGVPRTVALCRDHLIVGGEAPLHLRTRVLNV